MFAKYLTMALAGTALLATAASAQTPSTTMNRTEAASSSMSAASLQGDWRASKVVGLNVYNDNNEKVGSINDLLMDKNGNIKAAVLGVGGFLGVGEHLVAVPLDKIKFVNEPASSTSASTTTTNRPVTTTGSSNNSTMSKSDPWYPDHAVFNATKDQLKAMPEFKYSS
ncbi:MAG TPA: PRC-barrel domain-containing protein [Bradyrhizobium sp.]|nr:PRC-barrel domain-containing protein [Bradyrhizobium sp.]